MLVISPVGDGWFMGDSCVRGVPRFFRVRIHKFVKKNSVVYDSWRTRVLGAQYSTVREFSVLPSPFRLGVLEL